MKRKTVVLAGIAALLLGVPVLVGAQQAPLAVKSGDKNAPKFVGGSGKTIPGGALEVVQAGPGAGIARDKGATSDLGKDLGRIIEDVDGAVLQGPCEVAARGGVSFFIPEGSTAVVAVAADGSITITAVTGTAFARNADLVLTVGVGGTIAAGPTGRFTGVTGRGSVSPGSGDQWVGFSGQGGMGDVLGALQQLGTFSNVQATQGAVSTSNPF